MYPLDQRLKAVLFLFFGIGLLDLYQSFPRRIVDSNIAFVLLLLVLNHFRLQSPQLHIKLRLLESCVYRLSLCLASLNPVIPRHHRP